MSHRQQRQIQRSRCGCRCSDAPRMRQYGQSRNGPISNDKNRLSASATRVANGFHIGGEGILSRSRCQPETLDVPTPLNRLDQALAESSIEMINTADYSRLAVRRFGYSALFDA